MSLVLELQQDALDSSVTVSALLRKAFVVAKKLNITEFADWTELELNGYVNKGSIPEYRFVKGTVKGFNPYHGWQPIFFPNEELEAMCTKGELGESISELESFLTNPEHDIFHLNFAPKAEQALRKGIGQTTSINLHIDATNFKRVLERVRNIILNWTLQLENDGITGESMTFSKEEKATAAKNTYNVNNFYAAVNNQQIQQGNDSATQHITITGINNAALVTLKELISDLRTNLTSFGISSDHIAEFEADLGTLDCQVNSTKPKSSIIKESLSSIRKILESASGGVIANQIYTRIPALLQLLG